MALRAAGLAALKVHGLNFSHTYAVHTIAVKACKSDAPSSHRAEENVVSNIMWRRAAAGNYLFVRVLDQQVSNRKHACCQCEFRSLAF